MSKPRHIVVFDLDGTLTRRDTFIPFLSGALVRYRQGLLRSVTLPLSVGRYWMGHIDNVTLKTRFLRACLAGADRSIVNEYACAFVDRIVAHGLRANAVSMLRQHQEAGAKTVLLSASLDIYVPLIGSRLGFDEVICTQAEWVGERLTGNLAGPNCYGEEKGRHLRRLREREGRVLITAYADQASDLPLLQLADEGILVNASGRLARVAAEDGIKTIKW